MRNRLGKVGSLPLVGPTFEKWEINVLKGDKETEELRRWEFRKEIRSKA